MLIRSAVALLVGLTLFATTACGPQADLTKLEIAETFSGYYDWGVVRDGPDKGQNKLVPSVSFRLKNNTGIAIDHVAMTVSFWPEGADGEKDSKEVPGIGGTAVEPGGLSDPILVRSEVGYTTPVARHELFEHSGFKDFVVKFFAKRGGKIVPLGEVKVDRRIIPQTTTSR
jgi:hypothetical protein